MLANYLRRRDRELEKVATRTPLYVKLNPRRLLKHPDEFSAEDNEKGNQCNLEETPATYQPYDLKLGWDDELQPPLAILKQRQFAPEIPGMPKKLRPSATITRRVSRSKVSLTKRCERCKTSRTACKNCRKRPLSESAEGSLARIQGEPRRPIRLLDAPHLDLEYIKAQFSKLYESHSAKPNPVVKPTSQFSNSVYKPKMRREHSVVYTRLPETPALAAKAVPYQSATSEIRPLSARHKSAFIRVEVKILPKMRGRHLSDADPRLADY